MSKTVDERVVSMQFDNSQFEKNVGTTMSTLDKLKQALHLDGATKGLDNVNSAANKMNFSKCEFAATQAGFHIQDVFEKATRFLENDIARRIVNVGKSIATEFTVTPITTGFQEYELKMGSVQTIMASTGASLETVNEYLRQLNEYSDKTIYSFSDMTNNIGKFTNAGVELDKAVLAIKGVSNEAAISGANAQEASRAMYNFSQALSAGYVKLIDWKSIENANMATVGFKDALIQTAVACGTLTDNLDGTYTTLEKGTIVSATQNFNDSLQEQWMTTEVLTETLAQYATDVREMSEAEKEAYETKLRGMGYTDEQIQKIEELGMKAYDAAQDVKTFSMMMDTLKEAAQSGWAETWEIIIGDFNEAKKLWTELSDLFGKIIEASAKARNDFLGGALDSNFEKFIKQVNNAGVSTDEFCEKLKDTAKEEGVAIDELIEKHGSMIDVILAGELDSSLFLKTLEKFAGTQTKTAEATEDLTGKLEKFQKVVDEVWHGDYGNGEDRVKALTEAGYEYAEVQELVDKTVDGHRLTLEDLNEEQLENLGYTEEEIGKLQELAIVAKDADTPLAQLIADMNKPSGRQLLIDTFLNVIHSIKNAIEAVKNAWVDIYGVADSSVLYNLIKALYDLSEKLKINEERADKIRRTFKGLFAILNIFTTLIGGGLKVALKILSKLLGKTNVDILEITAKAGDAAVAFRSWVFENNLLVKGLEKLINIGAAVIIFVKNLISKFLELPVVQKTLADIADASKTIFGDLGEYFAGGGQVIKDFVKRCSELDGFTLDNVKLAIKDFRDNVIGYFINIDDKLAGTKVIFQTFKDNVTSATVFASNAFKSFEETVGKIVDRLKSKLTNINIGSIFVIAMGGGLISFCVQLAKVIDLIGKPLKALIDFAEGFNKVMTGVTKVLNAVAMSVKAKALLTVAMAIGVLAASVALLAFIPADGLKKALKVLGILAAGIAVMMIILTVAAKAVCDAKTAIASFAGMGVAFLGLAACLLTFAVVLKIIGGMSEDTLHKAGLAIGQFMVIIIAMVLASSITTPNKMKSLASLIGSVSAVLLSLSLFCLIASKLDDNAIKNVTKIMKSFSIFIGTLMLISLIPANNVKQVIKLIKSISAAMLMLALFCVIVSMISDSGMIKAEAILVIFGLLCSSLVAISGMYKNSDIDKAGSLVLKVSAAMLLIAVTCIICDKMSDTALWYGLAVMGAMVLLTGAMVSITKNYKSEDIHKAGILILEVAAAMLIISGAIAIISILDPGGVMTGVTAVIGVVFAFGVFLKYLDGLKVSKGTIGVLNSMSICIAVLAISIAALSMIDSASLAVATGCISLVIVAFSTLIQSLNKFMVSKQGMIRIVVILGTLTLVIVTLVEILYLLGSMPNPAGAVVAAGAMALVLASLAIVCDKMSNMEGSATKAMQASVSVIGLAASLALVAVALLVLSMVNMNGILPKLGVMGLTILALGGICVVVNKFKTQMAEALPAIALMVVAGGLLAGLMIVLDNVNLGPEKLVSIAVGLAALAGGIIIIAGAAVLMQKLGANVALLTMATGFGIFAAAAVGLTLSIYLIIQALKLLATTTPEEVEKITATLAALTQSMITLMPLFAQAFATAIISMCDVIIQTTPKIVETIVTLVNQIVVGLTSTIPAIVDGFLQILASVLVSLTEYFPTIIDCTLKLLIQLLTAISENIGQIVTLVIDTIVNIINAISEKLPDIIQAAIDFMLAFIEGLGQGIEDNAEKLRETIISFCNHIWNAFCNFFGIHSPSTKMAEAGGNLIQGLINGIISLVGSVVNAVLDIGKKIIGAIGGFAVDCLNKGKELINNVKDGIVGVASNVANAAKDVGSKIVNGITGFASDCLSAGKDLVNKVKDGIADKASAVADKAKEIGSKVLNGIKDKIDDFKNAGMDLMNGLKDGINAAKDKVTSTVKNVADNVVSGFKNLLGIHSPSKVFAELGRYTDEGLIVGLNDYASKVKDASEDVGETAISGVSDAISKISDSFDDVDNTPTIRPVLDLSEIQNGSNQLYGMLDDMNGYTLDGSARLANSAMNNLRNNISGNDLSSTVSKLENTVKELANRPTTTTNNFNITGDNPREIANEVSRILQQQVERRDAVWV